VVAEPVRRFDCGNGPGKTVRRQVRGGKVGLILDGRGRPLALPAEAARRRYLLQKWQRSLATAESA
ncbi:MAG: methylaspartate mutase, partial [Planctomycetota bacterium]|nr:methylaspartate mutase [Planctomycetota bacterium]